MNIILLLSLLMTLPAWSLTCGEDTPPAEAPVTTERNHELCWAIHQCNILNQPIPEMPVGFKCESEGALARNCGLTIDEQLAIHRYMGTTYECINKYLRTKKQPSKYYDLIAEMINRGLDRFPNYEGFVVRGANLPKKVLDQHKVGKIVTYDAFTSSSTKNLEWGKYTFVIFSKTGKPIMSVRSYEYEVLFKSGTKFKVLKKEKNVYIMKEVTTNISKAEEEKEDAKILLAYKNRSKKKSPPEIWMCPDNGEEVPKKILQNSLPYLGI